MPRHQTLGGSAASRQDRPTGLTRQLLRADWEQVKDDVMREAVRAKFRAHADLRAELLATGDEELVENAPGGLLLGLQRRRQWQESAWADPD